MRQIALNFLVQDESQILYYDDRIKNMPVPVLSRHGVVEREKNLASLSVEKLTFEQKAHIKMLCERKMQAFVKKTGWRFGTIECSIQNPFQMVSAIRFLWNPKEDVRYAGPPKTTGVSMVIT